MMKHILLATAVFVATMATGSAFAASVSLNRIVQLQQSGAEALVSGTIQCRAGYDADHYVRVPQTNKDGSVTQNWGYTSYKCTGGTQSWEAAAIAEGAPFRAGQGNAFTEVIYCDQTTQECNDDLRTGRKVILRAGK
jgi:hypothetical protein